MIRCLTDRFWPRGACHSIDRRRPVHAIPSTPSRAREMPPDAATGIPLLARLSIWGC